jgi:hypothetical protein
VRRAAVLEVTREEQLPEAADIGRFMSSRLKGLQAPPYRRRARSSDGGDRAGEECARRSSDAELTKVAPQALAPACARAAYANDPLGAPLTIAMR